MHAETAPLINDDTNDFPPAPLKRCVNQTGGRPFYGRLGKATARGVSGTAEEIGRAADAGKPVHVYFSSAPLPSDVDTVQLEALRAFKTELQERSLLGEFASDDDLKAKARTAIERDVSDVDGVLRMAPPTGVVLRATYNFDREPTTDSKARLKYRNRARAAHRYEHRVGDRSRRTSRPRASWRRKRASLWNESGVDPDILGGSDFSLFTMMYAGIAPAWNVTMSWADEDGDEHSVTRLSATEASQQAGETTDSCQPHAGHRDPSKVLGAGSAGRPHRPGEGNQILHGRICGGSTAFGHPRSNKH